MKKTRPPNGQRASVGSGTIPKTGWTFKVRDSIPLRVYMQFTKAAEGKRIGRVGGEGYFWSKMDRKTRPECAGFLFCVINKVGGWGCGEKD